MDVEIHLENKYYPWTTLEESDLAFWVNGDQKCQALLRGSPILSVISSYFQSADNHNEALKTALLGLNGSFALVMRSADHVFCAVDRLRSIPLFYGKTDSKLIITDDANYLRGTISPLLDEINGAEFLLTGYVTGRGTLFDGICQIQAGEFFEYGIQDNRITTSVYHRFWHDNYYTDSEEELLNRLDEIITRVFERLLVSIRHQNGQIVVPLSGGLDSRIIVSMLKRCGVDNVICFSYGKKGNRQARISKRVAQSLGYRWHFVEYSKDNCDTFQSEHIQKYLSYAGNLASSPHLQDYFAVKMLKEERRIPENAIIVPGHSGDMLAGSHIPPISDHSPEFSNATFLRHIMKKNYCLWDWDDKSQLYS